MLDAKVERIRAGGRVEHRALVVADGVDQSGQREVIGLDVGAAETQTFWWNSCTAWFALAGRRTAGGLRRPRGPQAGNRAGTERAMAALQNDEWLVSRLYLSEASMAELTTQPTSTAGKELQVA